MRDIEARDIEARGMGLSIPLDRFSAHHPHEHAVCIATKPGLDDDAGRWCFWLRRPIPEYLLATCAERPDMAPSRLTFRRLMPSVTDECLELWLLKALERPVP